MKSSYDSERRRAAGGERGSDNAAEPCRAQTNESASGNRSIEQMDDRHRRISEAAYRIALQRGFDGEQQIDDWLQAEREIDNSSNDEQLGNQS